MLQQSRRMDLVLPEETLHHSRKALTKYWERYRSLFPEHEIFDILSPEALQDTIPIKLHGDEGRSRLAVV